MTYDPGKLTTNAAIKMQKELKILKVAIRKTRKDAFIEFACYLLDNHEKYFPGGEEEIQLICSKAVDQLPLKEN